MQMAVERERQVHKFNITIDPFCTSFCFLFLTLILSFLLYHDHDDGTKLAM